MNSSERVLILAPRGRDAEVAAALMREAGRDFSVVAGFAALANELTQGAGAAIVTDDAIEAGRLEDVSRWIEDQPSWSDFPFVFLTRREGTAEGSPFISRINEVLGNVIFLERPFAPRSLTNAVENALRGRRRQYQARANLDKLAEGEKRLAIALKAGRLGTFTLDIATRGLEASEHCKASFGRELHEELSYEDLLHCVSALDKERVSTTLDNAITTRTDWHIEFRIQLRDSSQRWIEMRGSVLPDRYNRAITMAGVSSDITARKTADAERESLLMELAIEREHTQDALRGERAFSGLLVGSVPAGIVAYGPDLTISTWNPVMERLSGRPAAEAVGKPLSSVIGSASAAVVEPRMREALGGNSGPSEEVEIVMDGRGRVWLEIQHAPLRGGDGQIVGGVAFFRDTTERRLAEEQLRQAQKMETIGQLTGGVAHDFNNLLSAVLGNLELLRKKLPEDPALTRHIEGAMLGAQRGAALTQRLLAFARRQDLKPEAVDLVGLIEGMRGLMERSLGPMVAVELKLAPDLPPANADPNQLELAVLNLAVNARDAMPEGGRLTITLDAEIPPAALGLAGKFVRLTVSDTGTGMDQATLQRAIEPFFSTKEIGKGTGLGLSMVHGLAVQLGGALNLTSEEGKGTSAELWLPVSTAAIAEPVQVASLKEAAPASSILVVDDDALIAMNTVDMVEDLGHTVLEAYSGPEALQILESGARVDALITDYAMPGMTGVELAQKARQLRPGLPILLATGYADLPNGTVVDLPRLGKPYQQRDLSEHLSKLLNGHGSIGAVK